MRDLFTNERHIIEAGKACSGIAEKGLSVRILHGRAWVTVEGVLHDYWLAAGSTLQPQAGHLTVIEADPAQGPLELRIERPRANSLKMASYLRALLDRLAYRRTIEATVCGSTTVCK